MFTLLSRIVIMASPTFGTMQMCIITFKQINALQNKNVNV